MQREQIKQTEQIEQPEQKKQAEQIKQTEQRATTELEEMVVTAARTKEKLKESPVTVNIVSEKEIETVKYRNAAEVLNRIPGVYSHNYNGEEELTSIRIPTSFANPYTLLLIDGLPAESYGKAAGGLLKEVNGADIERIEVIKGPASALYGSSAIGGVINIITRKPPATPEARIWGENGQYGRSRGGVSARGMKESLGYNVDLNAVDSTGWREHSKDKKKSGAIKLLYAIDDASLLTFKNDYLDSDVELMGSIEKADYDANWRQDYNTFTFVKIKKTSPSLSFTTSAGSRGELKFALLSRDLSHEVLPHYGFRYNSVTKKYTGYLSEIESRDIDAQAQYRQDFTAMRARIVAGVDSEQGKSDIDNYTLNVTRDAATKKYISYNNTGLGTSYHVSTDVLAPYIMAEASPFEKVRFSVGGRRDSISYHVDDNLGLGKGGSTDFAKSTAKTGVTFDATDQVNIYAGYSQGFVAPTSSQLISGQGANLNLDPEKADNYEVGLRSSLMNKRLKIDAAYYSMTIRDKIISQTTDTVTQATEYRNVGKTSHHGVEVSVAAMPADMLRMSLAYTQARNKYEDNKDPNAKTPYDYSGKYMPRSPKHHGNARLAVLPVKGLESELEMDMAGKQYADDANTISYTRPPLYNLRTTYDADAWSFWLHIMNLTDRKYASYVSASRGSVSYFPGDPLTTYAGVAFKW